MPDRRRMHSLRCDSGEQLEGAMERIAAEGEGSELTCSRRTGLVLLNKMKVTISG